MATAKEQVQDGAMKKLGNAGMGVALTGGLFIIGIIFVVLNWDNIGNLTRSADTIVRNEAQIEELLFEIETMKDESEVADKRRRNEQEEVNRDVLVRLGQIEAILETASNTTETLQEVRSTVDRFSNRFSDVEEDARSAEEKATSVEDEFQAYSVGTDRQIIELEKEVAAALAAQAQAKVERDRNTEFSSAQPQRAATRIEQIATLRRDTDNADRELHVFIDQTDDKFDELQQLREVIVGRISVLEAQHQARPSPHQD